MAAAAAICDSGRRIWVCCVSAQLACKSWCGYPARAHRYQSTASSALLASSLPGLLQGKGMSSAEARGGLFGALGAGDATKEAAGATDIKQTAGDAGDHAAQQMAQQAQLPLLYATQVGGPAVRGVGNAGVGREVATTVPAALC